MLKCTLLACLVGGLGTLSTYGQYTFNSGSDGTYGPMNIATNTTLGLPPDGKFNCTTITVASNATLRFNPNALNTPVYLLATGDVTINGTIDVSGSAGVGNVGGSGGPGGFAGGNAAYGSLPRGDGYGPGAGRSGPYVSPSAVGAGSYATAGWGNVGTTNNGIPYGLSLIHI